MSDHLRGPWKAVITDESRTVAWFDLEGATAKATFADDVFIVAIVRDSGLPAGDGPAFTPQPAWFEADMAHEIECPLIDDADERLSLKSRWAQAQAMAAGLNAAGGGA